MRFKLDELPYPLDGLEPHISERTLDFHYNKHHAGYMDKLESAIADSDRAKLSLEEIVCGSDGDVFRNAAQVWNHTFYWQSMAPDAGGKPSHYVCELLDRDVGGLGQFKKDFASIAAGEFGSGWAWLVCDSYGKLEILSTSDAGNPLCDRLKPIVTLDVWEHAYYLDYQNDRARYIDAFLDHLIDWRFVEKNLRAAQERGDA